MIAVNKTIGIYTKPFLYTILSYKKIILFLCCTKSITIKEKKIKYSNVLPFPVKFHFSNKSIICK